MDYSLLANELGLTEEELNEMGLHSDDIFQENDSSDAYYFNVPDGTPDRILGKKGWSLGERVKINSNVFDVINK
ncbi:hypothetical protein PRCB_02010 [Pantoea rodasii]|uniref:Uncharacterized protein n=1 Tax=Pantoea rodasii TaxID=1076549 RepID=A0A2M9WJ22_9GAMM|nr:hypothetical protein [Pantoea rodasii]ORM64312.1 hypothetical protein HA45_10880 [Pantoea rodasii]PJZ07458.1 hypothetical protein PRCB_02010 [Pantoea rodasii]